MQGGGGVGGGGVGGDGAGFCESLAVRESQMGDIASRLGKSKPQDAMLKITYHSCLKK